MAIIGIGHKKQSGKDTVGKIWILLQSHPKVSNTEIKEILQDWDTHEWYYEDKSGWEIKKFADLLKDFTCMLTGCTRAQLEDENFKNSEIGPSWYKWSIKDLWILRYFGTEEEALEYHAERKKRVTLKTFADQKPVLVKLTYRNLMELLGTDVGRDIVHPNIWVNSLMKDYKPYSVRGSSYESLESKWVITDVRFPNEADAIKQKGGVLIKVNRPLGIHNFKPGTKYLMKSGFSDGTVKTPKDYDDAEWIEQVYQAEEKPYIERMLNGKNAQNGLLGLRLVEHKSESALDTYTKWDYVIDNTLDMDYLIEKVRQIFKEVSQC